MKTVLCYGDSNTYGYNPLTGGTRWPLDVRWTGRLQELLGAGYRIIEEGCNGRTTMFPEPGEEWKSGLEYLKPCLNSHKPVDLVILMLGTNDLKKEFGLSAEEIAKGAERLLQEIYDFAAAKQSFRPEVILVSPPELGDTILEGSFGRDFDASGAAASKELGKWYREVAGRQGCKFLNGAEIAKPSQADGLHLMPEEHEKLAQALYACIREGEV